MIDRAKKIQRRKNLEGALAINSLGGVEPCSSAKKLFESYIVGEFSADEITKILIEKYTNLQKPIK